MGGGASAVQVGNGLPPAPRMPHAMQAIGWALRPTALLRECHRRHGDIFTLWFNGRAGSPYVFVSDPDALKAIATGDRDALRTGIEPDRYFRRAIVLAPRSGAPVRLAP